MVCINIVNVVLIFLQMMILRLSVISFYTDKLALTGVNKMSKGQFTFENYLFCIQNQFERRTADYRVQSKSKPISYNIYEKLYCLVCRQTLCT